MSSSNAPGEQPDGPTACPLRPTSVVVVFVLLLLEAIATLGVAVWYATTLAAEGPVSLGGRIFMLVLIVGAAAWQSNVAVQVYKGHAWTRAAALVWQVFQVIFAVSFLGAGGGATVLGIALLVPAAAVMLLIFDPKATAYFGDRVARS